VLVERPDPESVEEQYRHDDVILGRRTVDADDDDAAAAARDLVGNGIHATEHPRLPF
jgi:hypothetical protein